MATCPFCKQDPFHYVDNVVGFEPVEINFCDLGIDLYHGGKVAKQILELRQSYSPRKKARAKKLLEQYA